LENNFTVFFSEEPVTDFDSAKRADMKLYARFFHSLLDKGIYLPPSGYEAWFISDTHKQTQLELTVKAVSEFLNKLNR